MKTRGLRAAAFALFALALLAAPGVEALPSPSLGAYAANPDAVVDLTTKEGSALLGASWRAHEANVVEAVHREPGPDLKASGPANRTQDIEPKAGTAGFDDENWEAVPAEGLRSRRGHGRLSFGWYRTQLTIPDRVGAVDTRGCAAVLEIVVDDYAEVWIDGKLPLVLGQRGGDLVAGFNAPNRILLARDLEPGRTFDVAIFAANGALSDPPANFLWIRSATVDFYASSDAGLAEPVPTEIVRLDPDLDRIVAPGTRIEKLAEGFQFAEGPVWSQDGYLLLSDPNANRIYRWTDDGQVSVFRTKSGYAGIDIGLYHQPGSNGLAFDPQGRLIVCEHGNRRVVRIEKTGAVTVIADRFGGKRLNSPNDVTVRRDGSVCFTDPPFGLPRVYDDPAKELATSGIYCVPTSDDVAKVGEISLVSSELKGPNGIAFSPDEKWLYVSNWDTERKVVLRFPVLPGGRFGASEVFFDMTSAPAEEALDGVEVDAKGNLFVSGPGGIWVLSPDGRHLGTIRGPELPANFARGEPDGRTLFLAARTGLYRIRLAR